MVQDTLDNACADGLVITRVWSSVDLCGDTHFDYPKDHHGRFHSAKIIIPFNSIIQKMISGDTTVWVYLSQANIMNGLNALSGLSVIMMDNCDQEIDPLFQVSITPSLNAQADGYMEQRQYSWIATDICGNAASISFTVRLVDDIPPVLELPGDTVIYCSPLPPPVSMLPVDSLEKYKYLIRRPSLQDRSMESSS
jgi:hypothetical protein